MKKEMTRTAILLTAILALSIGVNAGVITGNFCSTAPVDNPDPGISVLGYENLPVGLNTAGGEWFNDLTQATIGGSFNYGPVDHSTGADGLALPGAYRDNLYYTDGTGVPEGVRIDWAANIQDDNDQRTDRSDPPSTGGYDIDNRHEQLFGGYLQGTPVLDGTTVTGPGTITLESTNIGLAYSGTYDIYCYVDGEDTEVSTWSATLNGTTYWGQDTVDFINDNNNYVRAVGTSSGDATAGANYVLFEDVSGDFTITLSGFGTNSNSGVVLNGFEIVPEPSSFALLALLGGVGGLMRRRRKA